MKLYRGDSLPGPVLKADRRDRGRSFADHFCGTGLVAKFADRGANALLRDKLLLDMILSHVGYERHTQEECFSSRSPFLSFTSKIDKAFDFAERTHKKKLVICPLEDASYFLWELDIDLPNEVDPGRYEFHYKANSINCRSFVMGQIQRGYEIEAQTGDQHDLAMGLMNLIAGCIADKDTSDHSAELVHVVPYVTQHDTIEKNQCLVTNTVNRASSVDEWLLYPTDSMKDGFGVSSRFIMNQHLRVHGCYRIQS